MLEIIRLVWTLPNQLLGAVGAIGGKRARVETSPRAHVVVGSWLGRFMAKSGLSSATTLGDFILIGREEGSAREALIAHERVHILQSNLLGPLYLPMTLIGYLMSGVISKGKEWHDASPLEIDADIRSGHRANVESNPFALAKIARVKRDV